MIRAVFALRRLGHIALNTLREVVRQKLLHFLVLLAVVLVVGAHYFRDLHFGSSELKFLADLGFGAVALFGAVLAVVVTAQLFYSELEHRTALTLLARPVGRAEFVLGKYLGMAVITGAFCAGLTLVLSAVLWTRESSLGHELPEALAGGPMIDYRQVALEGLLQWLKLLVLSAFTLLVASYARTQLFTMVTGFLLFAICHLQHFAQAAQARSGASVIGPLVRVLPNFQVFDLCETLGGREVLAPGLIARVVLYALAYVAAACALAAFSFQRREL